ncbi:MAG TPA: AmmeMemoRadiSam system protein A [Clostridiales bacterium]|nr:AmmeMemoRadiSam system protein A [Clostridiales bacterium]
MHGIINAYIFPHPPIIIPEVGRGRETDAANTIEAARRAAKDIRNDNPDTIIITTPHGPFFEDYFHIPVTDFLQGDMGNFGAPKIKLKFKNNIDLINRIKTNALSEGIYAGGLDDKLMKEMRISQGMDHGAMVPLYFVSRELTDFKLVLISLANMPFKDLYRFGMCISKAVAESGERIVFLASGDLSHSLTEDAPCGYNKKGEEFDKLLIKYISEGDVESILNFDRNFCEQAAECGLRSFIIMLGALDGYEIHPEVYSYEGPFGVGYSVAKIGIGKKNSKRELLKEYERILKEKIDKIRAGEDHYISLARMALEAYVREDRLIKPYEIGYLPEEMLNERAGAFVSIKKDGNLRGCIGTTGPTRGNLAEEIIHNAISAGTKDPRFYPVEEVELGELVYSVDILKEPERVKSIEELDVIRYGVIVRSGFKSGLLLPNLEGVNTPEEQVSIALKKAGIKPYEKYTMERFEVIRHEVK